MGCLVLCGQRLGGNSVFHALALDAHPYEMRSTSSHERHSMMGDSSTAPTPLHSCGIHCGEPTDVLASCFPGGSASVGSTGRACL